MAPLTDPTRRQAYLDALRAHLKLLTPQQIRAAIDRVGLSQKAISARTCIAEATLSRWLNETQIQSRAMDTLLRVFFAFPQVRDALGGDGRNSTLGLADVPLSVNGHEPMAQSTCELDPT